MSGPERNVLAFLVAILRRHKRREWLSFGGARAQDGHGACTSCVILLNRNALGVAKISRGMTTIAARLLDDDRSCGH